MYSYKRHDIVDDFYRTLKSFFSASIAIWMQYAENKSFCEDLTEGKFSFPVIHAIRSRPDDQQIINILRQRTKDMDVKRYCVSLLDKFGSFDYTRQTLVQLDLDARREIEKLGGNPILERVLDELKNWWRKLKSRRKWRADGMLPI